LSRPETGLHICKLQLGRDTEITCSSEETAQKVGEEAVELVIESKDDNKDKFLGEAADLLYHYLILLQAKNHKLNDVINTLAERQIKKR